MMLRDHSVRIPQSSDNTESEGQSKDKFLEATWAFHGGLNNHSRAARRRLMELAIARFSHGHA